MKVGLFGGAQHGQCIELEHPLPPQIRFAVPKKVTAYWVKDYLDEQPVTLEPLEVETYELFSNPWAYVRQS